MEIADSGDSRLVFSLEGESVLPKLYGSDSWCPEDGVTRKSVQEEELKIQCLVEDVSPEERQIFISEPPAHAG